MVTAPSADMEETLTVEDHQETPDMANQKEREKEVNADNTRTFTYAEHIAHQLALKRYTRTKLKLHARAQKMLGPTQADEDEWDSAHAKVALIAPKSHGSYTLKPDIWDTLEPEEYPYSDHDRHQVIRNISRKDNVQPCTRQPKSEKAKRSLESSPDPNDTQAKKRRVAESSPSTQGASTQATQPIPPQLFGAQLLPRLLPRGLDTQFTTQTPATRLLPPAPVIWSPSPNLASNTSHSESSTLSHPSADQSSGGQLVRLNQKLLLRIPPHPAASNQHLASSVVPSSNNMDFSLSANLSKEPSTEQPRARGYARRGGGSLRGRGEGVLNSSLSASNPRYVGVSMAGNSVNTSPATGIQLPNTSQSNGIDQVAAQKGDLGVTREEALNTSALDVEKERSLKESEKLINTVQTALRVEEQQGQDEVELEQALKRLVSDVTTGLKQRMNDLQASNKAKDDQIQTFREMNTAKEREIQDLKEELNQVNTVKDEEIQDLRGKLTVANGTMERWVLEDQKKMIEDQEKIHKRREQLNFRD